MSARENATDQSFLRLEDVGYEMEGQVILDAVSWTVEEHQHWAIIGPSGAGKTTLVRIACGFLWPNAGGTVYRRGKERQDLREVWKDIGWVSTDLVRSIPDHQSVLDTVVAGKFAQSRLMRRPGEEPSDRVYERARTFLRRLDRSGLEGKEFGDCSQGERQLILIARALMTGPYLMVFDEPCAGMDPGARETFLSALEQMTGEMGQVSFLYITHHIEELLPPFRHLLAMKEGRIVRRGRTGTVLTCELLEELYGIEVDLLKRNGRFWPVGREQTG